jgi:hypothetical protein
MPKKAAAKGLAAGNLFNQGPLRWHRNPLSYQGTPFPTPEKLSRQPAPLTCYLSNLRNICVPSRMAAKGNCV